MWNTLEENSNCLIDWSAWVMNKIWEHNSIDFPSTEASSQFISQAVVSINWSACSLIADKRVLYTHAINRLPYFHIFQLLWLLVIYGKNFPNFLNFMNCARYESQQGRDHLNHKNLPPQRFIFSFILQQHSTALSCCVEWLNSESTVKDRAHSWQQSDLIFPIAEIWSTSCVGGKFHNKRLLWNCCEPRLVIWLNSADSKCKQA